MNKLDVEKLLMETEKIKEDFLININNLLSIVSAEYAKKKEAVIEKYDLNFSDKFNIFETISDLYKREKFHSDILYIILNPNTPQIGKVANLEFVQRFIDILDLDSNLDCKFIVDETIEISKEEYSLVSDGTKKIGGYIDLLITNSHNQAIIIENKLNYAPDMPNQIVRYMKYIQEEKFGKDKKVDMTVVYLTLIPGKRPDISSYDEAFEDYTKLIKDAEHGDGKVLKYRCAIDSNREKGSLVKFLDDCISFIESKDVTNPDVMLTKVYLEQYKILLGHLGGDVAMLEYQKELLKNVYSYRENYRVAKDLVEVFEHRKDDILSILITEQLKDFVVPLGFCFFENWAYKVENDTTSDYLYVAGWRGNLEIGFGTNSTISKQNQKIYQDILENVYKTGIKTEEGTWVYLDIEPLGDKENLDSFLKFYIDLLVEAKQRFLEIK
ncbi:MAG: PD-(D/E)XK nuclease family protein [Treponema sp.]